MNANNANSYVRGRGRGYYGANQRGYAPRQQTVSVAPKSTKVPHDSVCCRGAFLPLHLSGPSEQFLFELKNMWNLLKKSPPVVCKFHQFVNTCPNPYEEILRLMYNCPDFKSAKTKSLPFFLIEEFKNWSHLNGNKIHHVLTPPLKMDAFKVISGQNTQSLTKLVVEAFEMDRDGVIFLDMIRCMIEQKKYKEACQAAILLKLQENFTVQDFLLPLVMQDKLFGIDEFLISSPRHQVELVVLLDSMLASKSVRDAMASYVFNLDIPDVKWDKMHAKPLKKFIARLVKTFKLQSDLTPNLNKRRNEGALQFLLHKRYVENGFGDESWKEMVQEAVGDDVDLQRELVVQVSMYADAAEALHWAYFYNIDRHYWPQSVRMFDENPDGERLQQRNVSTTSEDVWAYCDSSAAAKSPQTSPVEYLTFPLPSDAIRLVDSESAFEHFLDTALQNIDIVGIDCEWKPNFGSQRNELALMQISTRNHVFILDIIRLGSRTPHLWQELGNYLFNNCDILKLGFGFATDITMIRQSLPELNFSLKQVGFLDLLSLWKVLERQPKVVLPFEVQGGGPSLSTLVHQCLGRPLDKSDQFSNWEKRPLRRSQLVYASLDAHCLIQVYDVLRRCCEQADFHFDETCYHLMTNERAAAPKKKKPFQKKRQQQNNQVAGPPPDIQQPPSPHDGQVAASSIKVVCDTMLQGLGKNLRRCGVDAAILENGRDHMECVRYAEDQKRYILTRGNVFNKLFGYVPWGHCLKIISDDVDQQLKEFLAYYKVIVTKEDVFSVCQTCNGRSFVKVSRSTMLVLKQSKNGTTAGHNNHQGPADWDLDDDTYDEATGFSSEEEQEYEIGCPTIRKWDLYSDEKIDVGLCQTRKGATIQVEALPDAVLEKVELFYVCEECGKIFYDGSHMDRVLAGRLQDIVQ